MTRELFRTTSVLAITLAVASTMHAKPAHADKKIRDGLLAIGGALILNEMNKGNQGKSKSSSGSSANKSSGGGSSGGGSGNVTAQTQRALTELGYDPGPIDGQMGGKTRRAIEAFQQDRGYPVTGRLSTEQFAALNTAYSVIASPPPSGQMTREATYEAQLYLDKLGYNVGAPDGVWGPRSQAALDQFRASSGLLGAGGLAANDLSNLHMQIHGTPALNLAMVSPGNLSIGGSGNAQPGSGLQLDLNAPGGGSPSLQMGNTPAPDGLGSGLQIGNVPAPDGLGGVLPIGNSPAPDGLGGGLQAGLTDPDGAGAGIGAQGGVATPGSTLEAGTPPAAAAPPPADPSAYVHMSDRPVEGMARIDRRLAVQMVKARPALLDDMSNIQSWFAQDHPRGGQASQLRQAYDAGNQIEREDILRKFRADLLKEVEATQAISASAPQAIAFYQPVTFGDYVDGQGLQLRGSDMSQFAWRYSTRYLSAFATMRADLPGTQVLKITRAEAAQLMDFVQASKQRMFRVVWGQVSNVGEDKSVAEFAKSTGQFGVRDVATTFSVDEVTLNLAPSAYQTQPKVERALYKFELQSAPTRGAGTPVLSFLQDRGVPVLNGHLLLGNGPHARQVMNEISPSNAQAQGAAMDKLAYLTWLKLNPGFAEKDMNFVSVAARVMTELEKRQFFGDGAQNLHFYGNNTNYDDVSAYGRGVFADEFAAQDAKQAFLSSYYPRVLATLPEWPVPVIQVVGARLGSYDFDNQVFPIVYDGVSPGQPVAPRVVTLIGSKNRTSLVSADRLAALPQTMSVSVDAARQLRQMMDGNNRVYLAWTASFDMDDDGAAHELLFDPSGTHHKQTGIRPGRATLNRIALFRDSGLTHVLVEYDPAEMIQDPKFDTAPELGNGPEAILASMKLAEPYQLLKSAVELGGDTFAVSDVIKTHQAVRSANEFDVDGAKMAAREYWENIQTGDVWFQGQAQLGRYDRDTEMFPFDQQHSAQFRLQMGRENPFGARANPQFTESKLFEPLSIKEDVAREIVTNSLRTIQYYVRARPVAASKVERNDNQFNLMLQPMEVIYVQPNLTSGSVLQHRKFEDAENFFEEKFAASDFPELQERQAFDLATIQLLRVKQMNDEELDANLDNLMASTFHYESQRENYVPNPFFQDMRYFEPDKVALYRDRYRNWIKARAEALGTKFIVTHSNAVSDHRCGRAAMLRQDYDVPGQWGVDTAPMIADTNRIIEISQQQGDTTTAPDHLYFLGTIETENMSCNQQGVMGTLSLDGVGVVQNQKSNQHLPFRTRQIEFGLTAFEAGEGRNGVPLMKLSGIATETRYYDANERDIAAVPPTFKIVNTEGMAALKNANAEDAKIEQAAFVPDAEGSEPVDAPTEDSLWPIVDTVAFADTGRDTVGITLGMSMEEAEAVIEAEFDVTVGYETVTPANASEPAFDYARVYFVGGTTQAITLMSYSPDGPVMAVNRHLLRNDAPWPQDAITASLLDKYAEPVARTSDDSTLVWAAGEDCVNLPLSPMGQRRLEPLGTGEINGDFDPGLAAHVVGSIAMIADGNEEFLASSAACGETLMYSADLLSPVQGHYGFYTFMTDMGAVQSVTDALTVEEAPKHKIKF